MPGSFKAPERPSRFGPAVLAVLGVALVGAAALSMYQGSLAKARAVRETSPAASSSGLEYLPGSTSQIGTVREPRITARRAALRAGLDGDEAPVDAFDRLRRIPGHDDEARRLLAQYWARRAMLADDPVRRVLLALQARVVSDEDAERRTAASAIAALGPLESVRHVAEGTVVAADARTLVLRGSGWLHVVNRGPGTSFDLVESDTSAALVDARRMLAWSGDVARIRDLDDPSVVVASFRLAPGETPLSYSGNCVLTSAGRVWRAGKGFESVTEARAKWAAGVVDATCERVILRGDAIASYRRRAGAWLAERSKMAEKGLRVEACAARAPRCVVRSPTGARALWDFGAAPPRRLYEGVDCDVTLASPDGTRLLCGGSSSAVVYAQDEGGAWSRTPVVLPPMTGLFQEDDGAVVGTLRGSGTVASDRADIAFLDAKACWAPPAAERAWDAIHVQPTGGGAVFTFRPSAAHPATHIEIFGFDGKGESVAASNAWFGVRSEERLVEYEATNSAADRTYDLAGTPFDPSPAVAGDGSDARLSIDAAVFSASPTPSLVFGFSDPTGARRAVARWDLRKKRLCGPPVGGAMTGASPAGDAVVVSGRIYRVDECAPEHGLAPADATSVVAVGPGAALWIARDGRDGAVQLEGLDRSARVVPGTEHGREAQIAFSPSGARFLTRTMAGLCSWTIGEDAVMDLDGCRWSTAGWASDAVWTAADDAGHAAAVFDRTAEGAALREFFGDGETDHPPGREGDVACAAIPRVDEPPLAVLRRWEERLGHRFRDQATLEEDARVMTSPEIVTIEGAGR